MEKMEHILVGCPYSRITWHEVLSWTPSSPSILSMGFKFADSWWDRPYFPNGGPKGHLIGDYAHSLVVVEAA
jgi:hypothetical protein